MNAYTVDARDQPRFKMETDIRIYSRPCGLLKVRTVDISESGIAAMLTLEAPVGGMVELEFTLPSVPAAIHAMVRQKNALRYGFEFVDADSSRTAPRPAAAGADFTSDDLRNLETKSQDAAQTNEEDTVVKWD